MKPLKMWLQCTALGPSQWQIEFRTAAPCGTVWDQDRIATSATESDDGGLRHHGGGELRHPEVGDIPTGGGEGCSHRRMYHAEQLVWTPWTAE